jgi:2-methylcitrate dehydratase PrpD
MGISLFKVSYLAEILRTNCSRRRAHHLLQVERDGQDPTILDVAIRTQKAAIRVIDKQGPLGNFR